MNRGIFYRFISEINPQRFEPSETILRRKTIKDSFSWSMKNEIYISGKDEILIVKFDVWMLQMKYSRIFHEIYRS